MTRNFKVFFCWFALAIPTAVVAQLPQGKVETRQQSLHNNNEKVDRMPKVSGFVQGLYQQHFDNDGLKDNTFRMRRVRLSVAGNLTKRLKYKVQGDFLNSPMLVDAYLKYTLCPEFALQIGQFKTPFTIETRINPLNLEIFDYGNTVKGLSGYSDVCGVGKLGRDIGIMATGSLFPIKDKGFSIIDYSIGVFNGNGVNIIDNNNSKDFAGRIEIHPMLKALTLTGSLYYGDYFVSESQNGLRKRSSFGVQYQDDRFLVRSEYLSGETGRYSEAEGLSPDNFLSKGYYAVAGYWFRFGENGEQHRLMPVLRFESFEQNVNEAGSNIYTVGLNYWPVSSLNFKLDYSLIQMGKDTDKDKHRIVAILSYKF